MQLTGYCRTGCTEAQHDNRGLIFQGLLRSTEVNELVASESNGFSGKSMLLAPKEATKVVRKSMRVHHIASAIANIQDLM